MKIFNLYYLYQRSRNTSSRCISTCNVLSAKLACLKSKGILQVSGKDASKLLQGLVTNNMELLAAERQCKVIHTYVLNVQGRIINDVFIYKQDENDCFLLETDRDQCENLSTYLRKFKLRSKVKFDFKDNLNVNCLFDAEEEIIGSNRNTFVDPRLASIGYRYITDTKKDDSNNVNSVVSEREYTTYRYRLGLSEGLAEIENGIPLEHNGALLNSISFEKGCYIGQELVARAHFTGVIRKRVMPLIFDQNQFEISEFSDKTIFNGKGKRSGKLIAISGDVGLGLMRVRECLNEVPLHLKVGDIEVKLKANQPIWWPEDISS